MTTTTGYADLDVVLDPDRLRSVLDRGDITVTRVRHKPGQYAVAALADDEGPAGWARVTADLDRGKRDVERGGRVGREVTLRSAGGGLFVSSGDLWSDPKLAGILARHADVVDASVVVRHNPLRRLVLRRGAAQIRVTAEPQPEVEAWAPALLDETAALTAMLRGRSGPHLTRWEWVPGHSLEHRLGADPQSGHASGEHLGRLLARVHSTPHTSGPSVPDLPTLDRAGLRRAAGDLGVLDPHLGARMESLVRTLPEARRAPRVLLHGDYSADQVILTATGPRVIDLDRAGIGPAVRDIASALAVESLRSGAPGGPVGEGLRRGYEDAGGRWPATEDLAGATAAALLSRAQEPLRQARPDWRDATSGILAMTADLLR